MGRTLQIRHRLTTLSSSSAPVAGVSLLFGLGAAGATPLSGAGAEVPRVFPVPVETTAAPERPNPLEGLRFFVDRESPAWQQVRAWQQDRPRDAALLETIARQPQADWFGDWNGDVRRDVASRLRAVEASSAPIFVAYNIPYRDCGLYSAGGADDASAYRRWIRAFADGIGDRHAVVVLEPDALAGMDCLPEEKRRERIELLGDAARTLASRPNVRVYIDAGNPRWKSVATMADRLRSVGVEDAAGFALNVSNFIGDQENTEYGRRLSDALGGAHYVVDSSRNGAGATGDSEWCNPAGRALGRAPTWDTGDERLDAWLWIKRPGESDGTCNGGPEAGGWWAEYALGLASRGERMATAVRPD